MLYEVITYAQILTISAVYDLDGSIMNFVGLVTDITSMKEHQKELEKIAHRITSYNVCYTKLLRVPVAKVIRGKYINRCKAHHF